MANIEKLRATYNFIEKLNESQTPGAPDEGAIPELPEHLSDIGTPIWDQQVWMEIQGTEEEVETGCGTTLCCFAGWGALLDGWKPAAGNMVTRTDPYTGKAKFDFAMEVAKQAFELSDEQAEEIFAMFNDLPRIKAWIDYFAGERPHPKDENKGYYHEYADGGYDTYDNAESED